MFRTTRIIMALVAGIALAPLVLPLIAPSGRSASAQSLPWTPTPTAPATATATSTATPTAPATATATLTATPTAEPGTQPDRCEPNDTLTQPCALPTEIDNPDLTFVDDDVDVFSFLLKGGRTYTLRASSTTGIDPRITLYRAGDTSTALAENDDLQAGSPDAEVQVTTASDGWYLLVVANSAPGDMRRRTYTVSARSSATTQPTANATSAVAATQDAQMPVTATQGDVFENNYSPETAGTLAWGVPYDLSLVCPVAGQCPGGDHDFFWLPVKAGLPIIAVTYDLGPGADPAMTLYRPEAGFTDPSTGLAGWRAWAGNDDVVPGFTLRSQLLVTPDWSGYALLVIASSERADPPPLPPAVGAPGRYRLMAGPTGLAPVQEVLRAQSDIPAAPTPEVPTTPPTGQPADAPLAPTPASDAREVIKEESVGGRAVVVRDATVLYAAAPPTEADMLATYPEGAQVRLLGQTYAGWVKVQPADSVTPGWMFGPNLRPLSESPPGGAATPAPEGTPLPGSSATALPGVGTPTPTGGAASPVVVQPPLPTPLAAQVPPEARAVTIEVCAVAKPSESACTRPLEGVRVELVRVSDGSVRFVGLTDRTGRVAPSIQTAPGTAVDVQIGALGIRTPLPANGALLPVRVVEAAP
ncbi:hypothetical protein EKD04_017910 [Chloroflexales bacterium ZM16-3]|nr:hypothetical protein [Chloroflexales bacterium ZM16-3]